MRRRTGIGSARGEVAASTGSACHTAAHELSPVLKAMGAVRFSLGRWTTGEEIERTLELFEAKTGESKT
jgi:cysteine desulfurase